MPVAVGKAGEAAVRSAYAIGPKATVTINGRTPILDGLTPTAVREVKNVKTQSLTRQIRDNIDYAVATGREFHLYVRSATHLTGNRYSTAL
ncbi:putative toxin [Naumannella halotolerans]|uniref:putative toxin n=1 Tax=Naumannella halotolerans TaxID=993414 RepID=UPI00370D9927